MPIKKNAPSWQIFLDFDSTLLRGESFDLLAEQKGIGEVVAQMTAASMDGQVPLEQVLTKKLTLLAPTREEIAQLVAGLPPLLLEDAQEVIEELDKGGHEIWIVTANFHLIVDPMADLLAIPRARVIANEVYFDEEGRYAGFSADSPLSKTGGKTVAVQACKDGRPTCFVSDGVSDLPVKEVVDVFVGFGGVVARERVKKESDIFIAEPTLRPLLKIVQKNPQ